MTTRMLILGAGYSGQAIARQATDDWVGGTTRTTEGLARLKARGITNAMLFDGLTLSDELIAAMREATHLIQSIAPDAAGDHFLGLIGNDLKAHLPNLRWAAYLSTVGVYGDHEGGWVDEDTSCHPVSDRSIMRIAAETAWIDAGRSADVPVAIMRLSGIYGPGRNAFINLRDGKAKRLIKPGQVFNRIHVADIAAAALFLKERELSGTFNVTDDQPAPPQDVVSYAADLMGVAPPAEIDFSAAQLSQMARSFYSENKRVANGKLKAAGYSFRYSDYRAALSQLWNDNNWAG
ncbi:SDR family oxidoreductase [Pararhizobium haloflavum]|uniref:SDR family oxidoreductase n=1 Tax=Pararhizobium haloflavum TaxID=2037914 RepID=UPI000C193B25|nr:SDR family oxidoreductase [Pararhizobium haloflavum]